MCILVDGVVYHGKACVSSLAVSRRPIDCYGRTLSHTRLLSLRAASDTSLANCREEAELHV